MRRIHWTPSAAFIIVLILAACGGDDPTATPEPQPTITATNAPSPAGETPTVAATETIGPPTATSTVAATATSTATPPLPTPRPIATSTPTRTPPTPTPDPLTEQGNLLLAALLDERSLPEGWMLEGSDVRFEADPEQQTVCDLHEFPGRAELVVEAEAEFRSADGTHFFQQSIAEYPMMTAFQALSFARSQISECPEWQSPDGLTFQVEPVIMGLPTSDALAYSIRFAFNEQQFDGRWIFVRVFSYVMTMVYFAPEGTDFTPMEAAVFDAVPRLQVVSNEFDEPGYYDDLDLAVLMSMQLMSRGETLQLPENWLEYGVTIPEGEQRYNVCGLDLFTERFGALEELQNEWIVDRDLGPFLWQSVSTFPDKETAEEAMAYIRDTVSCAEFPDNAGNIWQVLEYPELGLGDESHAALVGIDDEEAGAAQGEFVFVRVGDQITVIVYVVVEETLDLARVQGVIELAVREVERFRR